jgi:hypothetical protein
VLWVLLLLLVVVVVVVVVVMMMMIMMALGALQPVYWYSPFLFPVPCVTVPKR